MWKDIKMRLDSTSVLINMASRKLFQDMIDSDKYPTSGIEYKQLNSGVSLKHLFSFLWLNIWLSLNDWRSLKHLEEGFRLVTSFYIFSPEAVLNGTRRVNWVT